MVTSAAFGLGLESETERESWEESDIPLLSCVKNLHAKSVENISSLGDEEKEATMNQRARVYLGKSSRCYQLLFSNSQVDGLHCQ